MSKVPAEQRDNRKVALRLEQDLIAGMFRPGEWLKQADIETMYGAHRFDVRMALLDLKTRHLIEHVPNRGYRVVNLSVREREDLIATRSILERAAVHLAVNNRQDQDIDELSDLVAKFEAATEAGDIDALRGLNFAFHDRFYAACGNRILAAEITALRQRGLPGARGWRSQASIRQSSEDHAEMVRLLAARNGDALANLIDLHLNRWRLGPGLNEISQFEA